MKVGRNDPCPCGSGKKYKHCCLAAAAQASGSPEELAWRRVRRALEGYVATMLRFIDDVYGPMAIHEAWGEFTLWEDEALELDPDTPHMQVFMPWFFHCWAPDPDDTLIEDESLHGRSPTRVFLERKGARLDPVLRGYLEACVEAPFSFYDIVRGDPGHGFRTRDVFTGEEREVRERSASMTMKAGDILYGQLATAEGVTLLEGCAPCPIPPMHKIALIELRDKMGAKQDLFARELLREWDLELRAVYLDLVEQLLEPQLPQLQNTDGDAIVPHRLVFDIDSPETAFDALKHLAFGEEESDLLESAERGSEGELLRVGFDWRKAGNRMHRSWDNTILGRIKIDGGRLTGEVNSAERAAALKQIIEQALGDHARYRATEIESIERALAESRPGPEAPAQPEQNDLAELPEVKARLREVMAAHYEDWLTQTIPALGGRTPLEAVKDADGREMVEALVRQIERGVQQRNLPIDESIVFRLRERLGLS